MPAALELGVGVEEAVGRHERDVGVLGPVRQHLLEDAGRRRLADRDRSGEADHERGARRLLAVQELLLLAVQPARGLDVLREQAGQREVDLLDLAQVELVAEAPQLSHLVGRERALGLPGQRGPRRPIELHVGGGLARDGQPCGVRHVEDCCTGRASGRGGALRRLRPMCGIVGYVGDEAGAGRRDRGTAPAGVPRLRLRRHRADRHLRRTGTIASRQARRQARQPREGDRRVPAPGRRRPASGTPAGPPTAHPTTSTPTRTSASSVAWPWCTTASWRTSPPSAPSWRTPATSWSPRPTPRSPRTCSRSRCSRAPT